MIIEELKEETKAGQSKRVKFFIRCLEVKGLCYFIAFLFFIQPLAIGAMQYRETRREMAEAIDRELSRGIDVGVYNSGKATSEKSKAQEKEKILESLKYPDATKAKLNNSPNSPDFNDPYRSLPEAQKKALEPYLQNRAQGKSGAFPIKGGAHFCPLFTIPILFDFLNSKIIIKSASESPNPLSVVIGNQGNITTNYLVKPTDGLNLKGDAQHRFFINQTIKISINNNVIRTITTQKELFPPLLANASGFANVTIAASWDGKTQGGTLAPDGIYTYTVSAELDRFKTQDVGKGLPPEKIIGTTSSLSGTIMLDDTPPVITNLVPVDGAFVTTTKPTISANYSDNLSGIDTSTVRLTLNGTDVTSQAQVTTTGITFTPATALTEGTYYTITLDVKDKAGNPAKEAVSTFIVADAAKIIQAATGGTVTVTTPGDIIFGASISIPAGALSQTETIFIFRHLQAPPLSPPLATSAGIAIEFGPNGTLFSTPVTISIPYQPSVIPQGTNPKVVRVYTFNTATNRWEFVGGVVDTVNNLVTAQVSHLSLFEAGVPIVDPNNTTVTISPTKLIADNKSSAVITVVPNDIYNNVLGTGHKVVLSQKGPGILGAVTDNGDGTYTAPITATFVLGTTAISAVVDGTAINQRATITFTVGPPAVINKVSGDNQTGLPGSILPLPFTAALYDNFTHTLSGQPIEYKVISGTGAFGANSPAAPPSAPPAAPPACAPVPSGIVSWWPGEGNTNDIVGNNNGTNAGGVTFVPGEVGQAFGFDGSANSFITLPNSSTLQPQQFTIEGWIKPDFSASNIVDDIMSKRNSGCSSIISYILAITKNGIDTTRYPLNTPVFTVGFGGNDLIANKPIPNDGNFHHVAATYDGAMMRLYLDGVFVGQLAYSGGVPATDASPYIGKNSDCGQMTVATIDEISFYNTALASAQIQAIFNAGSAGKCKPASGASNCVAPPSGLVGWWPFDTVSGNTTPDIIGSNDGTLRGGVTPTAGKVGQALSFNGFSSYVTTSLTNLGGSELTICYWFKGSNIASAVRQQPNGVPDFIVAGWNATGNPMHILSNDGGSGNGLSVDGAGGKIIHNGNWHLVTMTWRQNSPNGFASYLDGNLVAQRQSSNTPIPNIGTPVEFGRYQGNLEFTNGIIDEVAIWGVALTQSQIQGIFNALSAGMCKPPIITTTTLPDGAIRVSYSAALSASGGQAPYTWSIVSGSLPPGLSLPATGVISGTPIAIGTSTFTIRVTDSLGKFSDRAYSITISNCVPAPAGIVGWWPFDTVSNNVTPDIIGTNPGTLVNNPQLVKGKVGNALSFNGIDQFVDLGNSATLKPANAVSVNAWVYIDPNASALVGNVNHIISDRGYAFPIGGYGLIWDDRPAFGSKSIGFILGNNDGSFAIAKLNNAITSTGWYNLAGTYDSSAGNVILYINGKQVASAPYNKPIGIFPNNLFVSADNGRVSFFQGLIDEVAIFNRALAPAEVMSIYNALSAGMCKTSTSIIVTTDSNGIATSPQYQLGTIQDTEQIKASVVVNPAVSTTFTAVSQLPQPKVATFQNGQTLSIPSTTPTTTITGTTLPGFTVYIYSNNTLIGTAASDSFGNWTTNVNLFYNQNNLNVEIVDRFGNVAVDNLTVTLQPVIQNIASMTLTPSVQTVQAGVAMSAAVAVYDGYNRIVPINGSTVQATLTGASPYFPDAITSSLTNGVLTFNITFSLVGQQTIKATLLDNPAVSAQAAITITPGVPSTLVKVSGDNQMGLPGTVLPQPFVTQLQDRFGNPIAGENIYYNRASGTGGFVNGGSGSASSGQGLPSTSNLVSRWNAEGASPYNDQVDSNNATQTGTGVPIAANRGVNGSNAYQFTGGTGYLNVNDNPNLDPTAAITISAWVNITANTGTAAAYIIVKGAGPSGYRLWIDEMSNRIVAMFATSSGGITLSSTPMPSLNALHHIAATYNGANAYLYLDGTQVATVSQVGTLNPSGDNLTLGQYLTGYLDEILIYNKALSQQDITQLFNQANYTTQTSPTAQGLPSTSNLVSWWKGEGNANDSKGANNGNFVNPSFTAGKINQGFNFTGNNYVSILYNTTLAPVNITIGAWVSTNGSPVFQSVVDKAGDYNLSITPGGQVRAFVRSVIGSIDVTTMKSIPANTFTHVAFSYDGSRIKIYIGGVLELDQPAMPGNIADGRQGVTIGAQQFLGMPGTFNNFHGVIDELVLYNTALSDADIAKLANPANYQAPITSPRQIPNLVSWWSAERDATDAVSGNNGSLVNADFAPGVAGLGFNLHGVGSYVNIPDSPSLNPSSAMTVGAWVSIRTNGTFGLVSKVEPFFNPITGVSFSYFIQFNYNSFDGTYSILGAVQTRSAVGQSISFVSTTPQGIPLNTFTHISLSYDGNAIKLYRDGVELSTQPAFGQQIQSTSGPLTFGQIGFPGGIPFNLDGVIDEVVLYNRALNQGEITALADKRIYQKPQQSVIVQTDANGLTTPPQYQIGATPFSGNSFGDEIVQVTVLGANGVPLSSVNPVQFTIAVIRPSQLIVSSGDGQEGLPAQTLPQPFVTKVLDQFGNPFSGVPVEYSRTQGTGGFVSTSPLPGQGPDAISGLVSWWRAEGDASDSKGANNGALNNIGFADGVVGKAFVFNGVNSFIEVPNSNTLNILNQITVGLWIKPKILGGQVLIAQSQPTLGPGAQWQVLVGPMGEIMVGVFTNGVSTFVSTFSTFLVPTDRFTHIAFRYNSQSGALEVFANGVLQSTSAGQGTIVNTQSPLFIGGVPGSGIFYNGMIDEVVIYNRALLNQEITRIADSQTYTILPSAKVTVRTDANGIATPPQYQLGTKAGKEIIEAAVLGTDMAPITSIPPLDFTATVHAGPPAKIVDLGVQGQSGFPGSTLNSPFKVRLTDIYDNIEINWPMQFTRLECTGGFIKNGQLVPSIIINTDSFGEAASPLTYQLSKEPGQNIIEVSAVGSSAPKIQFTATASLLPLPTVTQTTSAAGITTTTISGTAFPSATVTIYNGQTLLGTATADTNGNYTTTFNLPDGVFTLTIKSQDNSGNVTVATVDITKLIAATNFVIVGGNSQEICPGEKLGSPFVVAAISNNTGLIGRTVRFTVTSSQGTFENGQTTVDVTTQNGGLATSPKFFASPLLENATVEAKLLDSNLPSVVFNVNVIRPNLIILPSRTTIVAGNPIDVKVKAVDANGNILPWNCPIELSWTGDPSEVNVNTANDPSIIFLLLLGTAILAKLILAKGGKQMLKARYLPDPRICAEMPITVIPGPPAIFKSISGNGQEGTLGSALANSFVTKVKDIYGNLISDLPVLYSAQGRGGFITQSNFAGDGVGDGGPATSAILNGPKSVLSDRLGGFYIADSDHFRVRRVLTNGNIITTVVGNGKSGIVRDGATANDTAIGKPKDLALDNQGNLYVLQANHPNYDSYIVFEVTTDGIIHIVAGDPYGGGVSPLSYQSPQPTIQSSIPLPTTPLNQSLASLTAIPKAVEDIPAVSANISNAENITLDTVGNLYISQDSIIRRIDATTGNITTVIPAGSIPFGIPPQGGAPLNLSMGIAVAPFGEIYIAESGTNSILKVLTDGTRTVFATGLNGPYGVSLDIFGNVYVADTFNNRVVKYNSAGGKIFEIDNLNMPMNVSIAPDNSILISDYSNYRVVSSDQQGNITTVAGDGSPIFTGDNIPASSSTIGPYGVVFGPNNAFILEQALQVAVKKVDQGGVITTPVGFPGDYFGAYTVFGFGVDEDENIYVGAVSSQPQSSLLQAATAQTTIYKLHSSDNYNINTAEQLGYNNFVQPHAMQVGKNGNISILDTGRMQVLQVYSNALRNPGFETFELGNQITLANNTTISPVALGWEAKTSLNSGTVLAQSNTYYSGLSSLAISAPTSIFQVLFTASGLDYSNYSFLQQAGNTIDNGDISKYAIYPYAYKDVFAGQSVWLTAKLKGDPNVDLRIWVTTQDNAAGVALTAQETVSLGKSNGWTKIGGRFNVPANITSMIVVINRTDPTPIVSYIDDVVLTNAQPKALATLTGSYTFQQLKAFGSMLSQDSRENIYVIEGGNSILKIDGNNCVTTFAKDISLSTGSLPLLYSLVGALDRLFAVTADNELVRFNRDGTAFSLLGLESGAAVTGFNIDANGNAYLSYFPPAAPHPKSGKVVKFNLANPLPKEVIVKSDSGGFATSFIFNAGDYIDPTYSSGALIPQYQEFITAEVLNRVLPVFTFTVNVSVTKTPNIIYPLLDEISTCASTTMSGLASPDAAIAIYSNGSLIGTTTVDNAGYWRLDVQLFNGVNNIQIVSRDPAGAVATTQKTITVSPAIASLALYPTQTSVQAGDTIGFKVEALDGFGRIVPVNDTLVGITMTGAQQLNSMISYSNNLATFVATLENGLLDLPGAITFTKAGKQNIKVILADNPNVLTNAAITVKAGAPVNLQLVGNNQSGMAGTTLSSPLVTQLTDAFGNGIYNDSTDFFNISGNGGFVSGGEVYISNVLQNHDFEIWGNSTSTTISTAGQIALASWITKDTAFASGGTISKETTIVKSGLASVKMLVNSPADWLYQVLFMDPALSNSNPDALFAVNDYNDARDKLLGKTLTFSVMVNVLSGSVRPRIVRTSPSFMGTTWQPIADGPYNKTFGSWERLTISAVVPPDTTGLALVIESTGSNAVMYVDNAAAALSSGPITDLGRDVTIKTDQNGFATAPNYKLGIQTGDNSIVATPLDSQSNPILSNKTFTATAVLPPPLVASPKDGSDFTIASQTITGTANGILDIYIYQNGALANSTVSNIEGNWSSNLILAYGSNQVTVTAVDVFGNASAANITLSLTPSADDVTAITMKPDSATVTAGTPIGVSGQILDSLGRIVPLNNEVINISITGAASPYPVNFSTVTSAGIFTLPSAITFTASGEQSISATVIANPQLFTQTTVTVNASAPTQFLLVSGNGQTVLPGQTLPQPFITQLNDSFGNPVPNLQVQYTAVNGIGRNGAFLTPPPANTITVLTDSTGQATSLPYRQSNQAGTDTIIATAAALSTTVMFNSTGMLITPTVTSNISGDTVNGATQTITGAALPGATVNVYGSNNNLLGTTTVRIDGTWSVNIPLNLGTNNLAIRVVDASGNTSTLPFILILNRFYKADGDLQVGSPNQVLPKPFTVALFDNTGAPITGTQVNFTLADSFAGTFVQLDSNGNVTSQLGSSVSAFTNNQGIAVSPFFKFYGNSIKTSVRAEVPSLGLTPLQFQISSRPGTQNISLAFDKNPIDVVAGPMGAQTALRFPVKAGIPLTVQAFALDDFGRVDTTFNNTISFSWTGTIGPNGQGVPSFLTAQMANGKVLAPNAITFARVGNQTITASISTAAPPVNISANVNVTVTPGVPGILTNITNSGMGFPNASLGSLLPQQLKAGLTDAFGNVITDATAIQYNRLTGFGGLVAISKFVKEGILQNPIGMAFDSLGNAFVVDDPPASKLLKKVDANGVVSAITDLSSVAPVTGIAIHNDNIYILANRSVYILLASNGYALPSQPFVSSIASNPIDIKLDSVGNLYIADAQFSSLIKVDSITKNTRILASTNFNTFSPASVIAIDSKDNLYYINGGGINKLDTKTNTNTPSFVANLPPGTSQIAVNSKGEIFAGVPNLVKINNDGSSGTLFAQSGNTSIGKIAVDNSGNLYGVYNTTTMIAAITANTVSINKFTFNPLAQTTIVNTDANGISTILYQLGNVSGSETITASVVGMTNVSTGFTVQAVGVAAPVITLGDNAVLTNNNVAISGTASGTNQTLTLFIDGVSTSSTIPDSNRNWNFNITLSNGSHTIRIDALDSLTGRVASTAITVTVDPTIAMDKTPPVITISKPVSGSTYSTLSYFPATFTITDDLAGFYLSTLKVTLNGNPVPIPNLPQARQMSAALRAFITPIAPSNTLTISVTDLNGNLATQSVNFFGSSAPQTPATLTKVGGDMQTGNQFSTLPQPFVVALLDANESPIAGSTVTFTVTPTGQNGGFGVVTPIATTDRNGIATSINYTLGSAVEDKITAQVAQTNLTTVFRVSTQTALTLKLTPNPTTVQAGVPVDVTAEIVDYFGRRITTANGTLNFNWTGTQGMVLPSSANIAMTNGFAELEDTIIFAQVGSQTINVFFNPAGPNSVAVSAGMLMLNVTPGVPSRLTQQGPQSQTGLVRDVLQPFVTQVTDFYGNLIPNYPIQYTRTAGAGGFVSQTNFAGGGFGDNGQATSAALLKPIAVYASVLSAGNGSYYIAEADGFRVRKVDSQGVITTVLGTGIAGTVTDGIKATLTYIGNPLSLAVDNYSNLYILHTNYQSFSYGSFVVSTTVSKVDTSGIVHVVAGMPQGGGNTADNILATGALLNPSGGIALDSSGNLYISEFNRIRKVDKASGIISTFASTNLLSTAQGIAFDSNGNLYVADSGHNTIDKFDTTGTFISVIVQLNAFGSCVQDVKVDGSGNLFIADACNNTIRVFSNGNLSVLAGRGTPGFTPDTPPILANQAMLNFPTGISLDGPGTLLIADSGNMRVRKVTNIYSAQPMITTIAGNGLRFYSGEGGPANTAAFRAYGLQFDLVGNAYLLTLDDPPTPTIRKIASSGVITTLVTFPSQTFAPTDIFDQFGKAHLGIDNDANLYVPTFSLANNIKIYKFLSSNGYQVPSSPFATIPVSNGMDVKVDNSGNIFILDNNGVRKVDTNGNLSVVTNIAATAISLDNTGAIYYVINGSIQKLLPGSPMPIVVANIPSFINNIVVDSKGGVFVTDASNNVIKINSNGSGATLTSLGISASITALALDRSDNLYVTYFPPPPATFTVPLTTKIAKFTFNPLATTITVQTDSNGIASALYRLGNTAGSEVLTAMPSAPLATSAQPATFTAFAQGVAAPVILYPQPNSVINMDKITINGTVSQATLTMQLFIDGNPMPVSTTTSQNDLTWSFSGVALSSGVHTIKVTASDHFGFSAFSTVTVNTIDTTGPAITVTSPNAGATYSAQVPLPLTFEITDSLAGFDLSNLQLIFNGQTVPMPNLPQGRQNDVMLTANIQPLDGQNTLSISIKDITGNPTLFNMAFGGSFAFFGNLSHTAKTANSITWQWTPNPNATEYTVFSGEHSSLAETPIYFVSGTSFTQAGLAENTQYTNHVHAITMFGNIPSSADTTTTLVHTPTVNDFGLTLRSWEDIDVTVNPPPNNPTVGLTGALVEASSDYGNTWQAIGNASFQNSQSNVITHAGLIYSTTYAYRITYKNALGELTQPSAMRLARTEFIYKTEFGDAFGIGAIQHVYLSMTDIYNNPVNLYQRPEITPWLISQNPSIFLLQPTPVSYQNGTYDYRGVRRGYGNAPIAIIHPGLILKLLTLRLQLALATPGNQQAAIQTALLISQFYTLMSTIAGIGTVLERLSEQEIAQIDPPFSLIELLVVIGIIGIITADLIREAAARTSIQVAREGASRTSVLNPPNVTSPDAKEECRDCPKGVSMGDDKKVVQGDGEVLNPMSSTSVAGSRTSFHFCLNMLNGFPTDSSSAGGATSAQTSAIASPGGTTKNVFDGRTRNNINLNSSDGGNTYQSASPGFYGTGVNNSQTGLFDVIDQHGNSYGFHPNNDGSNSAGQLAQIVNRQSCRCGAGDATNTERNFYDSWGRMTKTIDAQGRVIKYNYHPNGRLAKITDFLGRTTFFCYDSQGHLRAVTKTPVKGTPNGNDFLMGKTTVTDYIDVIKPDGSKVALITKIWRPQEAQDSIWQGRHCFEPFITKRDEQFPAPTTEPYIQYFYNNTTDPAGYDYLKVSSVKYGGTNESGVSAGGVITYNYQPLTPITPSGAYPDTVATNQTTVIDRNGNLIIYKHDANWHTVSMEEKTRGIRLGDPAGFITLYHYNTDGQIIETDYPEGNSEVRVYDPSPQDIRQRGNLVEIDRFPGPRAADQGFLTTKMTYEPVCAC